MSQQRTLRIIKQQQGHSMMSTGLPQPGSATSSCEEETFCGACMCKAAARLLMVQSTSGCSGPSNGRWMSSVRLATWEKISAGVVCRCFGNEWSFRSSISVECGPAQVKSEQVHGSSSGVQEIIQTQKDQHFFSKPPLQQNKVN